MVAIQGLSVGALHRLYITHFQSSFAKK